MPRTARLKTITVPANLHQACGEFNSGRYFECHETLEEIWQEEVGDVRDCYKGLIQVAAAFVHVTRGNATGADRLFRTSLGYLAPYRAEGALGFDIEGICRDVERAHALLRSDGPVPAILEPAVAPHWEVDDEALPAEARRWRAWGFDRAGNPLPMEITVLD